MTSSSAATRPSFIVRHADFIGGFGTAAVGRGFGVSWWQSILIALPTFVLSGLVMIERLNPFKALHGYSFSLPGFAQGGVVPGAFGQPMPILAHGGEVVSTRGQQMRGGGSGGPQTIVVQLGTQEFARFVVDAQTGAVRRGVG